MESIKLALDWTPNTNHIGFFVSQELGFYKDLSLDVELLNPQEDNYTITPAKKVELGHADMALCPFESIISYRTKKKSFDAVAIATLFQEDLSGIVALDDSEVGRPKDLDGRAYASYKARYEDEIVRQMIINDGGKGEIDLVYPEKLGIWSTLLSKKYDATWIFMNWEGIQATQKGVKLNIFRLADYGIPYGYSPVIMASKSAVVGSKSKYDSFMVATKKGFLFAYENPSEAAEILKPFVADTDKDIDLVKSQQATKLAYGALEQWGRMEQVKVEAFLNWLHKTGLETADIGYGDVVYDNLRF